MLKVPQILVIALGLSWVGVGITGCGQRGALYLPTEPAAANRATLPEVVIPALRKPPTAAPAPAPARTGTAPTATDPAATDSNATDSTEKTTEPAK
ncbi:LPS translocon maturation chaperone LptM [Variovorax rhizosphaerae]|uniref:Lipoprotein n=1 Tax=Variovorax rhizosphaerae TaxID=1836200 RepID=A0ABU8WGE3_9BURK